MALIKCPECKKEISDKAGSCIHCGCPIEKMEVKKTNREVVSESVEVNNKKNSMIFGVVIGCIVAIIAIIMVFNSSYIIVPDVYGIKESDATSVLSSSGLIPKVEYEYDDEVVEGSVIRTIPYSSSRVEKNTSIKVIVSKGPNRIYSSQSTIEWYNIDYNKADKWEFENPYIVDNKLYIDCEATFGVNFDWKDSGFGTASINDTFDKKVPLEINVNTKSVKANEKQKVTLVIPVSDLDVKKPTTLYTKLSIERNGNYDTIPVNFSISW